MTWIENVAWAKDGKNMRDYSTQRFSSMMVFLSLMLGSEIGVLFSPSDPGKMIRAALENPEDSYQTPLFWAGTFLVFDVITTVFGILATFSAWSIISALSPSNAHCILRSTIGVYTCMLPSRMLLAAIYLFILWLCILLIAVMTESFTILMALVTIFLLLHIVSIYSVLANLVIDTGALSDNSIFGSSEEDDMTPSELTANLVDKAYAKRQRNDETNTPIVEEKAKD